MYAQTHTHCPLESYHLTRPIHLGHLEPLSSEMDKSLTINQSFNKAAKYISQDEFPLLMVTLLFLHHTPSPEFVVYHLSPCIRPVTDGAEA